MRQQGSDIRGLQLGSSPSLLFFKLVLGRGRLASVGLDCFCCWGTWLGVLDGQSISGVIG